MRLETVLGHAEDRDAQFLEFLHRSGKCDRFLGATGGVVLGIEVEHKRMSLQAGQRDAAAIRPGAIVA